MACAFGAPRRPRRRSCAPPERSGRPRPSVRAPPKGSAIGRELPRAPPEAQPSRKRRRGRLERAPPCCGRRQRRLERRSHLQERVEGARHGVSHLQHGAEDAWIAPGSRGRRSADGRRRRRRPRRRFLDAGPPGERLRRRSAEGARTLGGVSPPSKLVASVSGPTGRLRRRAAPARSGPGWPSREPGTDGGSAASPWRSMRGRSSNGAPDDAHSSMSPSWRPTLRTCRRKRRPSSKMPGGRCPAISCQTSECASSHVKNASKRSGAGSSSTG